MASSKAGRHLSQRLPCFGVWPAIFGVSWLIEAALHPLPSYSCLSLPPPSLLLPSLPPFPFLPPPPCVCMPQHMCGERATCRSLFPPFTVRLGIKPTSAGSPRKLFHQSSRPPSPLLKLLRSLHTVVYSGLLPLCSHHMWTMFSFLHTPDNSYLCYSLIAVLKGMRQRLTVALRASPS